MKKLLSIFSMITIVMIMVALFPNQSFAHKGALDKLGGHFRNSNCHYLLHKPTKLAKTAKTKAELVSLVKKYSSNKCKNSLTTSKLELEGYKLQTGSSTAKSKPKKSNTSSSAIKLHKKYNATLYKCVDGDTAHFKVNGKVYKTRFLFIDTPESTIKKEPYGKTASKYTCNLLKKAKKIQLETDGKSLYDKYNRLLAWVWVDGKLQQEKITKAGLVKKFYDYGNYKYENKIRTAMTYAKKHHKGMYK
ncbi:thermonuclease family protein [Heyndrickxia sp. NPDC080065]|uniref:thermonuclease family protein n=1 Tax=Heyndrickxia sp. NPDC080065 TaxID=3390568 RepID=UPI003D055F44